MIRSLAIIKCKIENVLKMKYESYIELISNLLKITKEKREREREIKLNFIVIYYSKNIVK